MNIPKIKGIIRHALSVIGSLLIALGFISPDDLSNITDLILQIPDAAIILIGAVLNVYAVVRSLIAPEKQITESQYQALRS